MSLEQTHDTVIATFSHGHAGGIAEDLPQQLIAGSVQSSQLTPMVAARAHAKLYWIDKHQKTSLSHSRLTHTSSSLNSMPFHATYIYLLARSSRFYGSLWTCTTHFCIPFKL